MQNVIYYARVSTEHEMQINSLKLQCEELEKFIHSNKDWNLVDKYVDEGKSATTTKGRVEFNRLLADMQTDKFDVIVIKHIDRGWRNTLDWKLFERELISQNKMLFIKVRNSFYDFTNPMDYMSSNFEAQLAEFNSRNQSIKMNDAHQSRMSEGRSVVTNGKMWGYKQVEGELVIDEEQAEVVKFVFEAYASGKGFRIIKQELDSKGIKNLNKKPFALTTLKRMIRNEKYKGTLICGKRHKNFFTKQYDILPESKWHVHHGRVPAIVSTELWEKANAVLEGKRKEFGLEEKRKIAGYFNGKYALSGKIKCGACGRPYYHSKYTTMKYDLWECQGYREFGKKHEQGCSNPRIPTHEMDAIIKEVIYDFWKNKDQSIDRVLKVLDKVLRDNDLQPTIDKLNKQKEKIKTDLETLLDNLLDETISKQKYKDKEKQLEEKLKSIEAEINSISGKSKDTIDKKERLLKIKDKLNIDLSDKEGITDEIIEAVVERVSVKPDNKLEITLNGSFTFEVERNKPKYDNVSDTGQDRYPYRGCFCKV